MSKSKNFQKPLSVLFDDETKAMLEKLTDSGRLSQAHVIRTSIRAAHAMTIEQRPTCANGTACHCPHTHTFAPRPIST